MAVPPASPARLLHARFGLFFGDFLLPHLDDDIPVLLDPLVLEDPVDTFQRFHQVAQDIVVLLEVHELLEQMQEILD